MWCVCVGTSDEVCVCVVATVTERRGREERGIEESGSGSGSGSEGERERERGREESGIEEGGSGKGSGSGKEGGREGATTKCEKKRTSTLLSPPPQIPPLPFYHARPAARHRPRARTRPTPPHACTRIRKGRGGRGDGGGCVGRFLSVQVGWGVVGLGVGRGTACLFWTGLVWCKK